MVDGGSQGCPVPVAGVTQRLIRSRGNGARDALAPGGSGGWFQRFGLALASGKLNRLLFLSATSPQPSPSLNRPRRTQGPQHYSTPPPSFPAAMVAAGSITVAGAFPFVRWRHRLEANRTNVGRAMC